MKTLKITLLSIITLVGLSGSAQEFTFGAKLGLNYTAISNVINASGLGYHLGGVANATFSELAKFRAELLLSNRRTTFSNDPNFTFTSIKTKGTQNAYFLAIPILYKFDANEKIALLAGPQVSFIVAAKSKTIATTTLGNAKPDKSVIRTSGTNGYRAAEFAFAIGGEYSVSENTNLGLRFVRGLQTRSNRNNATDYANVFQLSGCYNF